MGRKYKRPPIVEVVCEFRFEADDPWDIAIPGIMSERLKNPFLKRRQEKVFSFEMTTSPEGQISYTDRIVLLREDEKAFIQVSANLISVNHLEPYPSWQEYFPLIERGYATYLEVAAPSRLNRIGLRYVNRIELPSPRVNLEDYFNIYPTIGEGLPEDFIGFNTSAQFLFENGRDLLRVQLGSPPLVAPGYVVAIFDLDYVLADPSRITMDGVFEWINTAHTHIENVFENGITERARQLFEEE